MTVSRVLNGTAFVSEETSRRVYNAIQALEYRPNPVARALRGSSSHTIGVLLPYLYDPFFATCAHAINSVAQQRGYSVMLMTTSEDAGTELDQIRQLVHRQVDGLILIPAKQAIPGEREGAAIAAVGHVPVVTLDRPMPGTTFDRIEVENEAGGALGTGHLIQHGYRDIVFLGLDRELHTMKLRHRGYARAMRQAGLAPRAHFNCSSQAVTTSLLRRLFEDPTPPRALFTANGLVTRYVLESLSQLGLATPVQVALVAFDDFELADLLGTPLTVLRQPTRELGTEAAEMLFDRLAAGAKAPPRHTRVLPVELVIRCSCGCRPRSSGVTD